MTSGNMAQVATSRTADDVSPARQYRPAQECCVWVPHPECEEDWEEPVPALTFASDEEMCEWRCAVERCQYAAHRALEAERAQAAAAERTRFWIEQYGLAYLSREAKAARAVSDK
ncbi:unnamed protein product [Peniophora sp. CBMAI 1063]|nr:unnamed protein product [Peniophora sp. CBMAI 1063]